MMNHAPRERPLRIAHVTNNLNRVGGTESYIRDLATAQVQVGLDVRVLVGDVAGSPIDGADVRFLGEPKRLLGRFRYSPGTLGSVTEALRWADVVHAHTPFMLTTVLAALTPSRTPVLVSCYAHQAYFASRRRRAQLTMLTRAVAGYLAISGAERDVLVEAGVSRHRVTVQRPGVRSELLGTGAPWRDRAAIVSIGRLVPYKRHDLVVEACHSIGRLADLRVIGGGGEEGRLRELIARYGENPDRVLMGRISNDELAKVLGTTRVLVAMSTEESFGLTLYEALAAGARPVASDIPPHRETMTEAGEADHLVDPSATGEVVGRAIASALARPDGPVWRPPSWEEAAAAMTAAYQQALRSGRSTS